MSKTSPSLIAGTIAKWRNLFLSMDDDSFFFPGILTSTRTAILTRPSICGPKIWCGVSSWRGENNKRRRPPTIRRRGGTSSFSTVNSLLREDQLCKSFKLNSMDFSDSDLTSIFFFFCLSSVLGFCVTRTAMTTRTITRPFTGPRYIYSTEATRPSTSSLTKCVNPEATCPWTSRVTKKSFAGAELKPSLATEKASRADR